MNTDQPDIIAQLRDKQPIYPTPVADLLAAAMELAEMPDTASWKALDAAEKKVLEVARYYGYQIVTQAKPGDGRE